MKIVNFITGSIRNKLIALLILATSIPIVISIFISYNFTREDIKKLSIKQNENLINEGKENIVSYLDLINRDTVSIYKNTDVYKAIENGSIKSSNDEKLQKVLFEMYSLINGIHQVNLYITNTKQSFLVGNNMPIPYEYDNVELNYKIITKPYNAFIESPHKNYDYGVSVINDNPINVISIHRPIYQIPNTNILGYISIDLEMGQLSKICRRLYDKKSEYLYFINQTDKKIIYSSNEKNIGKKVNKELLDKIEKLQNSRGYFEVNNNGERSINIYQKVKTLYMDTIIVKEIPYSQLYKDAINITKINSFISSILLLVVIIITLIISINFTKPIARLIKYTKKIENGDLNIDIKVKSSDEFGMLEESFKNMMNTINTLILNEYKLEIENKTNQLKGLQAQINPHFMNNALQSIGTLALKSNEKGIYSLITSLGRMMSYNMNTSDSLVTLSREFEHVNSYLNLQKERFGDKLNVEFNIEEDTLNVRVPKIIIQPFVENYFKYAFKKTKAESELLKISAVKKVQFVEICIEDNGPGIEADALAAINQKIQNAATNFQAGDTQIGIINVAARLKLYFHNEADLILESTEGKGLRVIILIPLEMKGDK